MRTATLLRTLTLVLVAPISVALAGDDQHQRFATQLSGFNEVHFSAGPPATLRGAISTPARGTFKATIDDSNNIIHYELTYEGIATAIAQAHIHFGQRHTVGGIVAWLCQGTVRAPEGIVRTLTPECPANGVKLTGTITPDQVVEPPGQGIAPGEFAELVAAIRAGTTYANVHSAAFGPGEIRGHIRHDRGHRH